METTSTEETTTTTPSRPGVVTLVGVVITLWAVLAAIEAIALFFNRDNADWTAVYGEDEIIALSGAKWARLVVAIVVALRLPALTWFMLGHLGHGAFTWSTIVSLALGLFVLWALYGNDRSQAFYEGYA